MIGLLGDDLEQKMNITVFNEKTNEKLKVDFIGTTVAELLKQVQVNKETVLVARNNEILTDDVILQNDDLITLLSVISGG